MIGLEWFLYQLHFVFFNVETRRLGKAASISALSLGNVVRISLRVDAECSYHHATPPASDILTIF